MLAQCISVLCSPSIQVHEGFCCANAQDILIAGNRDISVRIFVSMPWQSIASQFRQRMSEKNGEGEGDGREKENILFTFYLYIIQIFKERIIENSVFCTSFYININTTNLRFVFICVYVRYESKYPQIPGDAIKTIVT